MLPCVGVKAGEQALMIVLPFGLGHILPQDGEQCIVKPPVEKRQMAFRRLGFNGQGTSDFDGYHCRLLEQGHDERLRTPVPWLPRGAQVIQSGNTTRPQGGSVPTLHEGFLHLLQSVDSLANEVGSPAATPHPIPWLPNVCKIDHMGVGGGGDGVSNTRGRVKPGKGEKDCMAKTWGDAGLGSRG
jgi:hypothetical protein